MSSIRVRLVFERPLGKSPEQCWMLVDKSSCKLVRDLEYLIVKKFFIAGRTILNLYLEEFLLPSQEKIEVIRENDIIRVNENKNEALEKSRKTSNKEKNKASKSRRKRPNSTDRQSTTIVSKSMSKYIQGLSPGARFPMRRKRKSEETIELNKSLKKAKHSLENNLEKNNVKETLKDSSPVADIKLTKNSFVANESNKKQRNSENNLEPNRTTTLECDSKIEVAKKRKTKKRRTIVKPTKDTSITTKLNQIWGNILSRKCSSNRSNDIASTQSLSSVREEACEISPRTAITKTKISPVLEKTGYSLLTDANGEKSIPQASLNGFPNKNNHIRFDSEEFDIIESNTPDVLNNAINPPLAHPRIKSILGEATATTTPNLSPIEANHQNTNNKNRRISVDELRQVRGAKRKDTYTNKSIILESTRVAKEIQDPPAVSSNVDASKPEKDFSKYPILHGPPRVGDQVAYKIIELSQSYTPEISKYKEGKVLSFDSATRLLTLKLTKESLERVTGDGHISNKFEILENEEKDGEAAVEEEQSDEVQIQWTSMIEPRLVDVPVNLPVSV